MIRRLKIAGLLVFAVFVLGTAGARWYTDLLWFTELGYRSVFLTVLGSRIALFLAVWVLSIAVLYLGWRWAVGLVPALTPAGPGQMSRRAALTVIRRILLIAPLVVGGFIAYSASAGWYAWRLALAAVPFGISDPLFGRDASFYTFWLPVYEQVLALLGGLLALVTLGGAAILMLGGTLEVAAGRFGIAGRSRTWAAVIIALWLALRAVGYRMRMFELLFSPSGTVSGAGYTEVHALLPALWALIAVSLLGGVFVLVTHRRRGIMWFVVPVAAVALTSLLAGTLYPSFMQQFQVAPNELARERPYLDYSIRFTRMAYGLDRIRTEPFDASVQPGAIDLQRHRDTIDNVRLWDWRPLLATYKQLQEIRLYYNFSDVDVDRYMVDGRLRQAMVSARELNQDNLPEDAQNWVNLRLKFTHGYGAVVSPANEFDEEGLPRLWLRDVPPVAEHPAFVLERPEIYYGEQTTSWVIVNTEEAEFSYPFGDQNVYTHYRGSGGVPVSGSLAQLAFASRLSSYHILLTGAVNPDSRIMINRDIQTRVSTLAPFLQYDSDPYMVLADGRLFWIIDAYTTSSRFPYSQPWNNRFNYLRNPVKVVIDAYEGDVTFYVVEEEPMVMTMSRVFPDLFRPVEDIPEYLAAHIRVPVFSYAVMAEMLTLFHMQDPMVFYNREDLWRIPSEVYAGRERQMEPYYQIMRLPEGEEPEFVLILPFTPSGRENMIGLLAARSDGPHYGQMILYQLPKDRLVYGPMQIEARISQDATISQKLTLWGQSGSDVIRGHLLVIPIEDTLLYIEPLYLQSTETQLPELRRVIGSWGGRIVMDVDLETVLRRLLRLDPVPATEPDERPIGPELDDIEQLIRRAGELFRQADQRMRQGDWAGYGESMDELRDVLSRLEGKLETDD